MIVAAYSFLTFSLLFGVLITSIQQVPLSLGLAVLTGGAMAFFWKSEKIPPRHRKRLLIIGASIFILELLTVINLAGVFRR